jgi:hypothetical protein
VSVTASPISRRVAQVGLWRVQDVPARLAARPGLAWAVGLIVALVVTAPAWIPWLDPRQYLWGVDDAKNHMIRIYHLTWLIERGVWYPRWLPDMFMGYGYPVLIFYAPVFYYLAWGLEQVLRLSVWDAFRATGVVAVVVGAGGVYALTVALWRRAALGVLAAVVVVYGPYVVQINVFKRADLPEALALALIPWLLLALTRLWQTRTWERAVAWMAGSGLLAAAIVLTHNLTALLAGAVAAVWVGYLFAVRPGWRPLALAALAGVLALGLTTFFWLPAIADGRQVQLEELWRSGGLDFRGWFVEPGGGSPRQQSEYNRQTKVGLVDLNLHYPHQLVAPPKISWAQAGLGVLALGATAAGLATGLRRRRAAGREAAGRGARPGEALPVAGLPFLVIGLGCWYLTFAQSAWVWDAVPGLPLLQFPWRLFGPLGICVAVAGAGALAGPMAWLERRSPRRGQALALGLVAAVGAVTLFNHLGDREFVFKPEPDHTVDGRTVFADEYKDLMGVGTTSNREFLPREVFIATYTLGNPRGRNVYERLYPETEWIGGLFYPLSGDVRLLGWRAAPLRIGLRLVNDSQTTARIGVRQLRFPGWRAWIDGEPAPIAVVPYVPEQQASLGFMVLDVPPGEHTLSVVFGPTDLRLGALLVTVATGLVAGGALILLVGRRRGWSLRTTGLLLAAPALLGVAVVWRAAWPMVGPLAAAPAPAARQQAGIWSVPDLHPGEGALLVNVAEAVATGRAWITSPSGGSVGPGRHVDVRQLTVDDGDPDRGVAATSRRQWLYLHPPSSVSLDVALPAGRTTWFQSTLAMDPQMWGSDVGDGVRYLVTIAPLDREGRPGQAEAVLDKTVNPRAEKDHRRWVPVEADLSRWAGQVVRVTLSTLHLGDLNYDWSGWGQPTIAVRETDRVRPLAGQPVPDWARSE